MRTYIKTANDANFINWLLNLEYLYFLCIKVGFLEIDVEKE